MVFDTCLKKYGKKNRKNDDAVVYSAHEVEIAFELSSPLLVRKKLHWSDIYMYVHG